MTWILFAIFSAIAIAGGLGVVLLRDPVKGALSLISSFFSLACLYILQSAEMIAAFEVLVYAGAIMVLFVFVIMLVENKESGVIGSRIGAQLILPVKILGAAGIGYAILRAVMSLNSSPKTPVSEDFGGVASVARLFFDKYVFHFEFSSVLLMAGIVGAVIVSRRGKSA